MIDNNTPINVGYLIGAASNIRKIGKSTLDSEEDKNVAASEKVAKSVLAMAMISQLIVYYGGAVTDEEWGEFTKHKFVIRREANIIATPTVSCHWSFLAFHNREQRDNFLKYNEQLVKDYLMIDWL